MTTCIHVKLSNLTTWLLQVSAPTSNIASLPILGHTVYGTCVCVCVCVCVVLFVFFFFLGGGGGGGGGDLLLWASAASNHSFNIVKRRERFAVGIHNRHRGQAWIVTI